MSPSIYYTITALKVLVTKKLLVYTHIKMNFSGRTENLSNVLSFTQMKWEFIKRRMAKVEERVECRGRRQSLRQLIRRLFDFFFSCALWLFSVSKWRQKAAINKDKKHRQTDTHKHRLTVHCLYKHMIDPEAKPKLPTQLLN